MSQLRWDLINHRLIEIGISKGVLFTSGHHELFNHYKTVSVGSDQIVTNENDGHYTATITFTSPGLGRYSGAYLTHRNGLSSLNGSYISKLDTKTAAQLFGIDSSLVRSCTIDYSVVDTVIFIIEYDGMKQWDASENWDLKYLCNMCGENTYMADSPYYGVAWNGLTAVMEKPEGSEKNELFADNIKYAVLRSPEEYKATIEAYTYPEEFEYCDGTAQFVNGTRVHQQAREPFCFSFVSKILSPASDEEDYRLHLVYNCSASPSESSYDSINDNPDALTFSWDISSSKVSLAGHSQISTITITTAYLDSAGKKALETLEGILYGGLGNDWLWDEFNFETDVIRIADSIMPSPEFVVRLFSQAAADQALSNEQTG